MKHLSIDLRRLLCHLVGEDLAVRRRFPRDVLGRIESEIAAQERRHGGELRFAVEGGLSPVMVIRGVHSRQRAEELFSFLRIWDTELNNGVLVYLLLADRAVEIVADRGIHVRAGDGVWESICARMQKDFAAGAFEQGVVTGIRAIGDVLATHFPPQNGDVNELPDKPVVL